MPSGKHKSGHFRKVFVKAPGGAVKVHYRERKPSKSICGVCKKQLAGMPRLNPGKLVRIPRTARRPERPYGGILCSGCMREQLKAKARSGKEQVPLDLTNVREAR